MSLIRFNNTTQNINVKLYIESIGRIKIVFDTENDVPPEISLGNGFKELNEHNIDLEQSDFSDMKYLYQKSEDNLTYIFTNDENDIYAEPEISNENYPDFVPEEYIPTVDEVRSEKISNLSTICNRMIVNGVDIDIDGNIEHFSYTEEDQTNIKELFDLALQTNVPMYYHSDGNSCKLYSVEQIIELYTTAAMNKMHHITYFNQLKMYLNTLEEPDAIRNIEYGFELTGEYLDTYNAAMTQAKTGMETLLETE